MTTLLLVIFFAYLYAPYLIFKFFAEESIDIGRRKDETRVEEFFAAALPSLLLNAFTWFATMLVRWAALRFTASRAVEAWGQLDWRVVASILDEKLVVLRNHASSGLHREVAYTGALYLVAAGSGLVYGMIELGLAKRGVEAAYLLQSSRARRRYQWFLVLMFRRIWLPFFAETIVQQWVWTTRDTWAFVRTNDDRLFYGQIWEYTKAANGDVDTIVLIAAQRYSRTPVAACLANARSPLTKLHGSVVILWSQVVDLNVVAPEMMIAVRRRYAQQLRAIRDTRRDDKRAGETFVAV